MSVTELGQSQGLAWARSAGSSFAGSPIAELQEWLGGSKAPAPDPTPVSLEATTGEGWKSSYDLGERLSLEGLTLTITYSDGSKKSFQRPFEGDEWYFYPAEGQALYDVPLTLHCHWKSLTTQLELRYTNPVVLAIGVTGPTRKVYKIGEQLSLEGMVVRAHLYHPDGSYTTEPLQEKLGAVTDGYTLALDGTEFTSATIPAAPTEAGEKELWIYYSSDAGNASEYVKLWWVAQQTAINAITRPSQRMSFYTSRTLPPDIALSELPAVNAALENGEVIEGIGIDDLLTLAEPRTLFIEARYDGLDQTVVVNAADDRAMLKGVVGEHVISAYRYLYGSTQATAEPVSDWLSIAPPSGYGPTA